MSKRSILGRLDDLESQPSTDTWQLGVLWTPEEVAAAKAAGHTIISWDDDEPITGEADHDQDD